MAVERVWFPHVPDGTVSANDRARQGIGYGGIVIGVPVLAPELVLKLNSFFAKTRGYISQFSKQLIFNSTRN